MSPTTSRPTRRKTQPKSSSTTPAVAQPKPPRTRKSRSQVAATLPLSAEQRQQMIAEAAYYLAERRGFAGDECWADWYTAEAQIAALLEGGQTTTNH